jgi:hypothetical protein
MMAAAAGTAGVVCQVPGSIRRWGPQWLWELTCGPGCRWCCHVCLHVRRLVVCCNWPRWAWSVHGVCVCLIGFAFAGPGTLCEAAVLWTVQGWQKHEHRWISLAGMISSLSPSSNPEP